MFINSFKRIKGNNFATVGLKVQLGYLTQFRFVCLQMKKKNIVLGV